MSSTPPALDACAVLIATRELLHTLRQHVKDVNETLAFTDAEAHKALDAIASRRPRVVVIERLFAISSRGTAFIARIKADPALGAPTITIVSPDGRAVSLSTAARTSPEPPPKGRGPDFVDLPPPIAAHVPVPPEPFDYRGARRAPRFKVGETLDMLVDGTPARAIDLSVSGTQVLSPRVLRPGQRVRMTLTDTVGMLRANARIAWALYERPTGLAVPFYRAGMEFSDVDSTAMQAFCARHARV